MLAALRQRELTGKKIPIKKLLPIRESDKKCILCDKSICGLIVDLFEDMDVWDFRYHYFLPWNTCHRCRDPFSPTYI
jgi:transposase